MNEISDKFWTRPLDELSLEQWESLCDGCGRCCLHKLIDQDTEQLHYTRIACRLYDLENSCCSNYQHRLQHVAECADFHKQLEDSIRWMPSTCAYRLRWEGKDLPEWHYLLCGDRDRVHQVAASIKCFAQPHSVIKSDDDYFHHLLEKVL